jgi:tRNA threonylcarbamoyladenosine biosynthesis protein TsaB
VTVLAVETSMGATSAAVLARRDGETRLFTSARLDGPGQAEALLPAIERALAEARLSYADLTGLAVTVGPGSFSGVRTGLAAVRGLQLALGLPVFTASSLEVMAYGYRQVHGGAVAIAAPAGRDQLFCQCFAESGAPLTEPQALPIAMVLDAIPPGLTLAAGQGAALLVPEADRRGRELTAVMPELVPSAVLLAGMASRMVEIGARPPLRPLYLRPPDAKPQQSKVLARAEAAGRP